MPLLDIVNLFIMSCNTSEDGHSYSFPPLAQGHQVHSTMAVEPQRITLPRPASKFRIFKHAPKSPSISWSSTSHTGKSKGSFSLTSEVLPSSVLQSPTRTRKASLRNRNSSISSPSKFANTLEYSNSNSQSLLCPSTPITRPIQESTYLPPVSRLTSVLGSNETGHKEKSQHQDVLSKPGPLAPLWPGTGDIKHTLDDHKIANGWPTSLSATLSYKSTKPLQSAFSSPGFISKTGSAPNLAPHHSLPMNDVPNAPYKKSRNQFYTFPFRARTSALPECQPDVFGDSLTPSFEHYNRQSLHRTERNHTNLRDMFLGPCSNWGERTPHYAESPISAEHDFLADQNAQFTSETPCKVRGASDLPFNIEPESGQNTVRSK